MQTSLSERINSPTECWNKIIIVQPKKPIQPCYTHEHQLSMKLSTAFVMVASATAIVANPAPIEERQSSLPHIVCIPSGSSLSIIDTIYSILGLPQPSPIDCISGQTCNALSIPFIGQFIGVSRQIGRAHV